MGVVINSHPRIAPNTRFVPPASSVTTIRWSVLYMVILVDRYYWLLNFGA